MQLSDAYKVLGLQPSFTLDELKARYKKVVLMHHPDKDPTAATSQTFHIITSCYKVLLAELAARKQDRPFYELRQQTATPLPRVHVSMDTPSKFDIDRFNQVFDETRVDDVYSSVGYKDWLSKQSIEDEKDRSLIKYREPSSLTDAAVTCFELGKTRVSDWSGENSSKRGLHFMDCRTAYTTRKLVDDSVVAQRKDYKTVTELEADRSNLSYQMSPSDVRYQNKLELKREKAERSRLAALEAQDRQAFERHMVSNQLLLQHRHAKSAGN